MKEFKFEKAVVRIHGSEPSNIRSATERFVKQSIIQKKRGEKKNG